MEWCILCIIKRKHNTRAQYKHTHTHRHAYSFFFIVVLKTEYTWPRIRWRSARALALFKYLFEKERAALNTILFVVTNCLSFGRFVSTPKKSEICVCITRLFWLCFDCVNNIVCVAECVCYIECMRTIAHLYNRKCSGQCVRARTAHSAVQDTRLVKFCVACNGIKSAALRNDAHPI